jgi:hypothetical protein
MSIFKIWKFYNFYYYRIKNINHQNYASTCMKQSTLSIKLGRREYNNFQKLHPTHLSSMHANSTRYLRYLCVRQICLESWWIFASMFVGFCELVEDSFIQLRITNELNMIAWGLLCTKHGKLACLITTQHTIVCMH